MVVARAGTGGGGGELRNPFGNPGRDPQRSRMIEVHESRQDGVGKTIYGMETNFEKENSNIGNQTASKITAVNHQTNDHRSLERRLGAVGRLWAADTGMGVSRSDLSSGSSNVTPGLRLLPVPRSWNSISS